MNTAFILINAETGHETEVLNQLKGLADIKEANLVYGTYDVIARLESKNMEDLKNTVSNNIRRMKMVRSTLTMLVN